MTVLQPVEECGGFSHWFGLVHLSKLVLYVSFIGCSTLVVRQDYNHIKS